MSKSKRKEVLKAYTTFKAVRLNPGINRVVFKYNPLDFYIAAFISIIFLILFSGFYVVYRKKNG